MSLQMNKSCTSCLTNNRSVAKYCKRCGATFFSESSKLDEIVGMHEIKAAIQKIINVTRLRSEKSQDEDSPQKMNLHTVLFGNTGTGKSMIIRVLCNVYHKYGIITETAPKIVDAVDYQEFSKNIKANMNNIKGWMLVIDNVHKLVPAGYSGRANCIANSVA